MNLFRLNKTAKVIERSEDGITFEVDDVKKTPRSWLTEGAARHFARWHKEPVLAFSHDNSLEMIRENSVHPLAGAVHLAFSHHRPLRLTPDHVWLTIAQGFAHHVNNQADTLRSKLVSFSGKMVLQVTTLGLENAEDWAQVISEWAEDIGDFIPPELHQTLLCDFTTTTAVARVASQVVMMDAFQRFFDYRVYCICGIPAVTLAGTVEDWRRILSRVEHLTQYDLHWWTERLQPICRAFVETAEGKPPLKFWQSIYKPEGFYGEKVITGWLADLFPYVLDANSAEDSSPTRRNPVLSIPRQDLTVEHGITPSQLPRGLSQVPVTLETNASEQELELRAGFIGVRLDRQKDERIEPEIGWGVCEAPKLAGLLTRIQREHQTEPAFVHPDPKNWGYEPQFPHELLSLLDQFDGGILYGDTNHSWRIRTNSEYDACTLRGLNLKFTRFIDLADGRCILCNVFTRSPQHPDGSYGPPEDQLWIIVGKPEPYLNRANEEAIGLKRSEVKVIAKGLEQFFERILRAEGQYFFDQSDFIQEDTF
jgi:hypothetical protein